MPNSVRRPFTPPDYKALFEFSPSLYMILDANFTIIQVSNAYAQGTMTKREEVVGRSLFDVFPDNPNDPNADGVRNLKASLERVIESKMPDAMDIQKYDIRKPGTQEFEERYWSPLNCPVLDKDHNVMFIIHRAEDVTSLVKLQKEGEEQLKINESLRNLLTERTRMIGEREQLITSLKKSNEDLDRFAYTASHDLRSPLRAIDSLSQFIEDDLGSTMPAESKKHLETMRQRIKRMEKLLDDLLTYARLDGMLNQKAGDFTDGKTLVKEITDVLARPVEMTVKTGKTMADITVPRIPLQQVLRNLIDNAIKHHNKKDGEISVDVEDKGYRYVFTVRDNGPGIPPEYHQKIFEMFKTLQPRDKVEGSGMGLAFVKKILSHYGSTITVESALGTGAAFSFDWPKTIAAIEKGAKI